MKVYHYTVFVKSAKQKIVTKSSTEAKLVGLFNTFKSFPFSELDSPDLARILIDKIGLAEDETIIGMMQ